MRVAVVILNWNGKNWLEKFLPKVIAYSKDQAKIIVADNASTDDSLAFVKEHFPEVHCIQNTENGGYAKGYNDALAQVKEEYFVLLNSDVEVSKDWLLPLIALMDQHKDVAACQPKILDQQRKDYFEYAGGAGGFLDKYGYPFCKGRLFHELEKDHGQYDGNHEIVWASGAAMFVRASDFFDAGGFDEDFFAHHEEIDLCWRWQHKQKKVMVCTDAIVYHVGGGTLDTGSPYKTYLNYRNSLFVLLKNLPSSARFPRIFMRMILDGVSGIQLLVTGKGKHTIAILKAHMSFYRMFFSMLKKAPKTRHLPTKMYKKSIVFAFFLGKKKQYQEL